MSSAGDYILGVIGLVAVVLSMAIAGRTTRRAALPTWTGTPALLADAVLAIGMLVVVAQLLGLFGLLDGVLLVAASLIVGGGALRLEPMLISAGARVAQWGKGKESDLRPAPAVGRVANPYFLGTRTIREAVRFTHRAQPMYLVTRLDALEPALLREAEAK